MLPPILLGACPQFLAAGPEGRLLAVTVARALWLWDMHAIRLLVKGSLAPLFPPGKATRKGAPAPQIPYYRARK